MSYSVQTEDFEGIEKVWENLLPDTPANTIFVTPWWQKLWWNHFGKDQDADLQIASVTQDGELLGIAPMMLRDGTLSFLGDTDLFDYHDFLVKEGREEDFYNALCEYIVDLNWNILELKSLRESSETLKYIPALAEQKGYQVEIHEEDVAPVASLVPTWDEYLGTLRRKDRHELRRKLRRLESADTATQYVCEDTASVMQSMDDFFKLMRASSPDKDGFLVPERESFFRELAQTLSERGLFKLFFMEVNDVKVASCICFDYAGSYLLYNSGYDPEYSSLSVGLLNKALCVKDAIEEGKDSFDFLRGSERYKYDLGGQNRSVLQMVIRR